MLAIVKRFKFLFVIWTLLGLSAQASQFEAGMRALERQHYSTAMRAWLKLADEGHAKAQNNIGHLFEEGLGVSQNYSTALNWYKKAASANLPEAEHNIGMLYSQGYGLEKNWREAVKWFRKAASKELPDSLYMLGLAYYQGEGVKLDYSKAKTFFLKSAVLKYGPAQFMYSYMLQAGEGAKEPAPLKALIWAEIARKNGQSGATDISNTAKLLLEDQQINMVSKIVKKCLASNLKTCPK